MKGCINKVGNSWGFTLTVGKDANGKRLQKRYGKYKTKKEAEKACNDMIYQLEHGTYVDPQNMTLEEYLKDWLKTYCKPNLAPCTYRGYEVNIDKHIIPHIGKIPLQKLQPMQVQKFYTELLDVENENDDKKISATTVRYIHATLRKALNDALKMQYIIRNVPKL
jgi:hypothetical protein